MAVKKGQEVATTVSEDSLALLREEYPTEASFNRTVLPRFGLISQDVTEEKKNPRTHKKEISIVTEAGTFYTEVQGEEIDPETQQKAWERSELGSEAEGIIFYQRKQLKYFDNDTEKYTSSPVYDSDDEVIPLFLEKKEIDRGTPAELQAKYPGVTAAGKPTSKLESTRVLYVLIGGAIFQLNLRGSSMYSFFTYARKTLVPSVLTRFGSEHKEKGSIEWNMMTFDTVRPLDQEEVNDVIGKVQDIKSGIQAEKSYYAGANASTSGEQQEMIAEGRKAAKNF